MQSEKPEGEKRLNTNSVIVIGLALAFALGALWLRHPDYAWPAFTLAFGVAALPQPIRGDK